MNPAIAVPAFNRPAALERLLRALAAADVAAGTPLLIAIDCPAVEAHATANAAVAATAHAFRWPHGPLEIVAQPAPLRGVQQRRGRHHVRQATTGQRATLGVLPRTRPRRRPRQRT